MRQRIQDIATGAIGALLFAFMVVAWWTYQHPAKAVVAQAAAEIAGQKTRAVPCSQLNVYPDSAKKKLGITDGPGKLTGASKVADDNHPHTVAAVTNPDTGDTQIYVRDDPLPWIAFNQRKELSVYWGGESGHSGAVWRTQARFDFMQIKALNISGIATLDSDGVFYRGIGARLEF